MEKEAFIALLDERMKSMNIPQSNIEHHIAVLSKCVDGKSPEDIDKIIAGLGGFETILRGIYDLEIKKYQAAQRRRAEIERQRLQEEARRLKEEEERLQNETIENLIDKDIFEQGQIEEESSISEEAITLTQDENVQAINQEEIKEQINEKLMEFAAENGYLEGYDSTPNKFEEFFDKISSKIISKKNKRLLIFLNIILFPVSVLFYAVFTLMTVIFTASFVLFASMGTVLLVCSFIYALFSFSASIYIAVYEAALGITLFSICLVLSVLTYNGMKRLCPFLFSFCSKMIKALIKTNKEFKSSKAVNL